MRCRRSALPLLVLVAGCSSTGLFRSTPATAHDRYAESLRAAGLDSTALGREWLAASDSALRAPHAADLPAREAGAYVRDEARAVAWRVALRDGQRFRATVRTEGMPARLYLDLFEATGDTAEPFRHRATADSVTPPAGASSVLTLEHEARRDALYVLRLQPELLRAGRYEITMGVEPALAFPVEGGTNRSIQSGWGVERDGGVRSHQGIDIFAPRGTPVLAAAHGTVRSTRPNALGGNVVWLHDPARGQNLYYAHLDSHAVSQGDDVAVGDTLGFVGNSGNARSTPPHLHFGIYRDGAGPIDPTHWVRMITDKPPALGADTARVGSRGAVRVAEAVLRASPDAKGDEVGRVARDTLVRILGVTGGWFRVQLEDGRAGYVASGGVQAR